MGQVPWAMHDEGQLPTQREITVNAAARGRPMLGWAQVREIDEVAKLSGVYERGARESERLTPSPAPKHNVRGVQHIAEGLAGRNVTQWATSVRDCQTAHASKKRSHPVRQATRLRYRSNPRSFRIVNG